MKKIAAILTGAALMLSLNVVIANAYTIDYSYALNGTEFTSNYSGALSDFQLLSFNSVTLGGVNSPSTKAGLPWSWTGNAKVVNGSLSGRYAAPYGFGAPDRSNYLSVPNPVANGKVNVQLGQLYDYFGLWWGSVDNYNTLSFYNGKTQVASFTGSDATSPSAANGNQTAPSSNLYVNFLNLPPFDMFELKSTSYAFEADNITVGNSTAVPEPGTLGMLAVGTIALFFHRNRKKHNLGT